MMLSVYGAVIVMLLLYRGWHCDVVNIQGLAL